VSCGDVCPPQDHSYPSHFSLRSCTPNAYTIDDPHFDPWKTIVSGSSSEDELLNFVLGLIDIDIAFSILSRSIYWGQDCDTTWPW